MSGHAYFADHGVSFQNSFIFRVVMVEALSADLSTFDLMQYYTVCDFAFNFNFVVHLGKDITAEAVKNQVLDWMNNMPKGETANWVVSSLKIAKLMKFY